ncbi:acyloxyacyl hydrolase [Qipengyuania thermophila]|uniref:acyloxyacyl hydrolase n=1 Tax=Qipengyuania thermophila TaxID=2509361 RepID=UPI0013EB88BA|nr:acyloxyacyl hydrolase [Qipengyuania thermophila]
MAPRSIFLLLAVFAAAASPASAQEVFGGFYAHAVDTPFTLETGEGGAAVQFGYRFAPSRALAFAGSPEPYVFASVNTAGDTSFAGGGLSWKADLGPVYLRPGIGLVIHNAPALRVDEDTGLRTDLGSRVLFEPELAVGTRLTPRLAIEASWVHISNGRFFNQRQNPGIDTIGVRLNWRL